jgi:streptogrisin C
MMRILSSCRLATTVACLAVAATGACVDSDTDTDVDDAVQSADTPAALASPEVMIAMQRDLGISAAEVPVRLQAEAHAAVIAPAIRDQIGSRFAGAWLDETGNQLTVATTDPAAVERIRRAGAEPRLVERSLAQLEAFKSGLDQVTARPGAGVHAWYVDVATNSVVVEAEDPAAPAVAAFVGSLGLADGTARVVATDAERPRPLYDTRGGDEYIINSNTLCSIGFSVNGGFVTAGHCGQAGSPTAGSNWVAQGTFRGSSFPTNDYAWVQTNGNWNTLPNVNNYAGGVVDVAGSQEAAVGSSVCRSGRTSGWHCGVIQARNVTINYAQGAVYEATQTNACAEGGDSGGSFISGNQAQGVTSGGSGNCSTGGTTFFQPVNEILNVYGLSLKTSGGGSGALVSNLNGKCIDVPGSNFVDGARLQMWGCNGTGAQRWESVGGTLQAGGKCMDVAGANPADGTPIQLASCNGNRAQQFVLNGAGDLVSVLANKCVDIAEWNQNDGARLLIWPCHGGANQKWHR